MITGVYTTNGMWFGYRETNGQETVLRPEEDFVDPRMPNALRRLRHPGLAAVYAIGNYPRVPFRAVVCEWIRGRWLRRKQLSPDSARALICEILRVRAEVTALIGMPWAHLDLKPDHIIIRPNGKPVLLDPASACLFPRAAPGTLRITPAWAAPEVIRGEPCPASDLYSLALIWLALVSDDPTHPPPDRAAFAAARERLPSADFDTITQWLEPDPTARVDLPAATARAYHIAAADYTVPHMTVERSEAESVTRVFRVAMSLPKPLSPEESNRMEHIMEQERALFLERLGKRLPEARNIRIVDHR